MINRKKLVKTFCIKKKHKKERRKRVERITIKREGMGSKHRKGEGCKKIHQVSYDS